MLDPFFYAHLAFTSVTERPLMKAIVIGAGFGAIAAALRLRAKGYDVSLIDRCSGLGGRAQVYERNGFKHDAGPTVIKTLTEIARFEPADCDGYRSLLFESEKIFKVGSCSYLRFRLISLA